MITVTKLYFQMFLWHFSPSGGSHRVGRVQISGKASVVDLPTQKVDFSIVGFTDFEMFVIGLVCMHAWHSMHGIPCTPYIHGMHAWHPKHALHAMTAWHGMHAFMGMAFMGMACMACMLPLFFCCASAGHAGHGHKVAPFYHVA